MNGLLSISCYTHTQVHDMVHTVHRMVSPSAASSANYFHVIRDGYSSWKPIGITYVRIHLHVFAFFVVHIHVSLYEKIPLHSGVCLPGGIIIICLSIESPQIWMEHRVSLSAAMPPRTRYPQLYAQLGQQTRLGPYREWSVRSSKYSQQLLGSPTVIPLESSKSRCCNSRMDSENKPEVYLFYSKMLPYPRQTRSTVRRLSRVWSSQDGGRQGVRRRWPQWNTRPSNRWAPESWSTWYRIYARQRLKVV